MKALIFLALIYLPSLAIAQNCSNQTALARGFVKDLLITEDTILLHKTDSLHNQIDPSCTTALIYIHQIKGNLALVHADAAEADQHFSKALELATMAEDKAEKKNSLNYLAKVWEWKDNYKEAIRISDEALDIDCDDVNCEKYNITIITNKAEYLRNLNEYDKAISLLNEAIQMMDKSTIKDSLQRSWISHSMGLIYQMELSDFVASASCFKEALNYAPVGHRKRLILQNNVGNAYVMESQVDSATHYYNKTLNATTDPKYTYRPLIGLGDIHMFMKDDKEAGLRYYQTAYDQIKSKGNQHQIHNALAQIGKAHYFLGNYPKALDHLNTALNYYQQDTVQHNRKSTQLERTIQLFTELAMVDERLHLKTKSHMQETESLFRANKLLGFNESLTKLNNRIMKDSLELQTLTLEKNKLKLKNRTYSTLLFMLGMIGSLFGAKIFYNKYRTKAREIKELIFQNKELESLNKDLKKRIASNTTPINQKIELNNLGKKLIVPSQNLLFIKAEDNGTRVYLQNKDFWSDTKFKEVNEKLPQSEFVQIFRSTIININHVESIQSNNVVINGGNELRIGRTYKKEIVERLKV